MCGQVHALWRLLSQLLHCSDGSVSVTLVVECRRHSFATLSSGNGRTPSLSPCRQKAFMPQVTYPFGCRRNNIGQCPSSWTRAPSSRGWLQKRRLLPRRTTRSAEGLRHPCTRSRTEVAAQLGRFSTVLDVVNRVLGIQRTPCTRADSESVSACAVPSRFDRGCQDL